LWLGSGAQTSPSDPHPFARRAPATFIFLESYRAPPPKRQSVQRALKQLALAGTCFFTFTGFNIQELTFVSEVFV
jgi:hypothetical protein